MAQVQTVRMIDDLDGTEADEEIQFGLDGKVYEIDLSEVNAAKLRAVLAEFVAAGRKVGGGTSSRRSALTVHHGGSNRPTTDRAENQKIRAWAIGQGMKVSERGRIPSEVLEAYAHRDKVTTPKPTLAPVPAVGGEDKGGSGSEETQPTVLKTKKGKATPAPTAANDTPLNDDEVMAWWTGVKKFKAPTGDKVNGLMRAKYRKEVLKVG